MRATLFLPILRCHVRVALLRRRRGGRHLPRPETARPKGRCVNRRPALSPWSSRVKGVAEFTHQAPRGLTLAVSGPGDDGRHVGASLFPQFSEEPFLGAARPFRRIPSFHLPEAAISPAPPTGSPHGSASHPRRRTPRG